MRNREETHSPFPPSIHLLPKHWLWGTAPHFKFLLSGGRVAKDPCSPNMAVGSLSTEHYRRGWTPGASHTQYYNINNISMLNDIKEGPQGSLEIASAFLKNKNTEPTRKIVFILFSMEKRWGQVFTCEPNQNEIRWPTVYNKLGACSRVFPWLEF